MTLTLEQAKTLKVGQRVRVLIPVETTGEDAEGEELEFTTEAGALAQITSINRYGAPQGHAITVDFVDDRGGYATFDEGDDEGRYPLELTDFVKAPELSGADLATILAALRFYQQAGQGEPDNRSDDIHDIATNGDQEISLDAAGIVMNCVSVSMAESHPNGPPTWQASHVRGWRDRIGGIIIQHDDGAETYVQPGDDANDLADTLDACGDDEMNIGVLLCDMLEGL